ncbi:hypothetical protein NQ318_006173 [Aromia moschata]|uniref:Uncharacterized protein n=1 Tax=Aromia moschata TaxID=1265417 RepID=A0AAV8XR17_9CUCU|nr:hypothetical protein NQ318_006173 [Aromia moschata]
MPCIVCKLTIEKEKEYYPNLSPNPLTDQTQDLISYRPRCETDDVKDLPKSGCPKITQDKKIDIVLSMEENSQSTSTLVASENEARILVFSKSLWRPTGCTEKDAVGGSKKRLRWDAKEDLKEINDSRLTEKGSSILRKAYKVTPRIKTPPPPKHDVGTTRDPIASAGVWQASDLSVELFGKFETETEVKFEYFPKVWVRYVDDIFPTLLGNPKDKIDNNEKSGIYEMKIRLTDHAELLLDAQKRFLCSGEEKENNALGLLNENGSVIIAKNEKKESEIFKINFH